MVLGVKKNYYFETTDVRPAAFYITNPNNILIGNRAAGNEYYGFVYYLENEHIMPGHSEDRDSNCP